METGEKSTESRRMRVRVINLNPKMAEEKELHETLKLLRKREPAKQWETTVPPLETFNGENQNQPQARKELWEARSLVPGGREGSGVSTQRGKGGEAPDEGQPLHRTCQGTRAAGDEPQWTSCRA